MAHTAHQNDFPVFDPSMRGSFVVSGLFHLTIFLLTIISLPYVMKEPPDISTPISVEIVDIDKITQTNKVSAPVEKLKEDEKPQPVKQDQPPPSPPKQVEAPTPDTPKPVPLEKVKPPEEKALKPPPKKPPVKSQEKKEDKPKDFNSLLKNLTPDAKEKNDSKETLKDILASARAEAQTVPLGQKITMSEIDALKHQLAGCWNVLSGAKYAEDLVVEVQVVVNPDRTVQQATIINQPLYNQDTYYRAAADAAIRALHNPKCSPLNLPPDKYNEWKVTTIKFDPREMLQ